MPERIAAPDALRRARDAARALLEQELADGYSELLVATPQRFAALSCGAPGPAADLLDATLGAGDRLAMLAERIDELSLAAPRLRRQRRARCSAASSAGSTGSRRS